VSLVQLFVRYSTHRESAVCQNTSFSKKLRELSSPSGSRVNTRQMHKKLLQECAFELFADF
jgi:hypothetical protein